MENEDIQALGVQLEMIRKSSVFGNRWRNQSLK